MVATIMSARLNDNQRELWEIQHDRLNKVYKNGVTSKKRKKAKVHMVLMSWAIALLARTSIRVYKEVKMVMKLPDIRHVQRETTKMVSQNMDKAFTICVVSMKSISVIAINSRWRDNGRKGVIISDSCSLNAGMNNDHVTNKIVGGNKIHRLSSLSQM
jgi:hypothetical protein